MNTIDLETAVNEIQQACEDNREGRLPYFFLVGAGISNPPVNLAPAIETDCKTTALKYKRTDEPLRKQPIDTYSHWFNKAYPNPRQRQRYLRDLIKDKNISQANFRLAHLLLKKTISNLVVTTNFDDFILRALTLFGNQPIVCDHPSMVGRIFPEEQSEIQIVHVHGTYWFYDCCNLRDEITNRALPSIQTTATMAALLDSILLMNRVPLVIGYSGWEGDVVMTALERRLKNRSLPYRLYWFCYRQEVIDPLPDWLKSHGDVYFVIPQQKDSNQPAGERIERAGISRSSITPASQSEGQITSDKSNTENVLSAQTVLDRLVQTFALDAPKLTSDPLQFLADQLRTSLPQDDKNYPEDNVYHIKNVIERIERAKQKEQEELQTQVSESQLEQVRDALRRSQYREAIEIGSTINLNKMTPQQLRETMESVLDAAIKLGDNSLEELGGYNLVLSISDILLEEKINEPKLQERVATALFNKGVVLSKLDQIEKAIETYEEVVKRFSEAPELVLREHMAKALFNKGFALSRLDQLQREIETYEEIVKRFGDATEPVLREHVAKALFNKGVALDEINQAQEAIEIYEEVERRFSEAPEPAVREQVAKALFNKGFTFSRLNQPDKELATYEEVLRRFSESPELVLREHVAKALFNKGFTLNRLNQAQEAIATYEEIVKRFGEATEPILREHVAKALVNKGFTLGTLNQPNEAIATYEEVQRRFGDATEPVVREQVAKALFNKGFMFSTLNPEQEIATYEEIVKRFSEAPEPVLREHAAKAFNGIGFQMLCGAKKSWLDGKEQEARTQLLKAMENIKSAIERAPEEPVALGNAGYIEFLLGNKDAARNLLTHAIELGGETIRQGELADADINSLPQDEEFRELVRSIPMTAN